MILEEAWDRKWRCMEACSGKPPTVQSVGEMKRRPSGRILLGGYLRQRIFADTVSTSSSSNLFLNFGYHIYQFPFL